jgi:hypothetical protein
MASSEDDDKQILRRDWLQHEYTLGWSRSADKDAENARKLMLSCCARSTDPEVRGAYNKWLELETISVFLKNGAKK